MPNSSIMPFDVENDSESNGRDKNLLRNIAYTVCEIVWISESTCKSSKKNEILQSICFKYQHTWNKSFLFLPLVLSWEGIALTYYGENHNHKIKNIPAYSEVIMTKWNQFQDKFSSEKDNEHQVNPG